MQKLKVTKISRHKDGLTSRQAETVDGIPDRLSDFFGWSSASLDFIQSGLPRPPKCMLHANVAPPNSNTQKLQMCTLINVGGRGELERSGWWRTCYSYSFLNLCSDVETNKSTPLPLLFSLNLLVSHRCTHIKWGTGVCVQGAVRVQG